MYVGGEFDMYKMIQINLMKYDKIYAICNLEGDP